MKFCQLRNESKNRNRKEENYKEQIPWKKVNIHQGYTEWKVYNEDSAGI